MRKFLLALVAVAAVVAPLVVTGTAHANPGSPNCMTKTEWRKINDGMTRKRVTQITSITGRVTDRTEFSDGEIWTDVDYRQCNRAGKPARGSWNTVSISYTNMSYTWDYSDYYFHAPKVDYKGSWSSPWYF